MLVALVHKPSKTEQASDLKGFLTDMRTATESCAAGVGESLTALHQINSGGSVSQNSADTIGIARYGAQNCSPANNMQLDDLTGYQVTESLAAYHLTAVVNDLVDLVLPVRAAGAERRGQPGRRAHRGQPGQRTRPRCSGTPRT